MRLRIRAVDIDVATSDGPYGAFVEFKPGFNVLCLDNSQGKSTCLQAIMYALGLEVVYGGYRRAAFQSVLTTSLEGDDGAAHSVTRSDILLEFENGSGQVITVRRSVKGNRDQRLVTVWEGPALSQGHASLPEPEHYYLGYPGSAQNDRGFHSFLAAFLGFDLPSVPRYEGEDVPLYLETIFPLFYIEQKRGWAALQLLTPTYYKIKDVQKRAFEYVLGLHVNELISQRLHLIEKRNHISEKWRTEVGLCKAVAGRLHGELRQLDDNLSDQGNSRPGIDAIVMVNAQWHNLPSYIELLSAELEDLVDIREASDPSSGAVREQIRQLDDELGRDRLNARTIYDQFLREQAQVETLNRRLSALGEDRRRAVDMRRLAELHASSHDDIVVLNCPTCHQSVPDAMNPESIRGSVMSPDEHLSFIDGQVQAFNDLLPLAHRSLQLRAKELASVRNSVAERESQLQELRESLRGSNTADLERLRRRARLEVRLEQYRGVLEELQTRQGTLADLYDEFHLVRRELQELPDTNLSFEDEQRLAAFEQNLTSLLSDFELESVRVNQVKLSRDNYRPEFLNFDLDAQVSGSDHIRLMWSYLIALLEQSGDDSISHHAGLLILDEPSQQEVSEHSFRRLCERAANAGKRNQQIIFGSAATGIKEIVSRTGAKANIISRTGRLIEKRDEVARLILDS